MALLLCCVAILNLTACQTATAGFSTFVDGYLDRFARHHPSIAAGNGIHQYDDRLEDFSAEAVAGEVAGLKQWRERLRASCGGT